MRWDLGLILELQLTILGSRALGGTQLWGELLEVKGEYVQQSVRPLGSQDLCTAVQTGTLGSGSDPFPGPVLEPTAIPLTDAIQQLLAHPP